MKPAIVATLLCILSSIAIAQEQPSTDSAETVPELINLYNAEDAKCRLSMSRNVQSAVACHSRSIYGATLNVRGWCYGRNSEANAEMTWHKCEASSLRFPPLDFEE